LHLTGAATDITDAKIGAWLAAVSAAGFAEHGRVYFHFALSPKHHFPKRKFDSNECVLTALNSRTGSALAATKN
jgi:hypothetical protein